MAESGTAITRFDFTSGPSRGTHLTLYATCLVHRGEARLETVPLASLASVRVAFARDPRFVGWAAGLLVLALVLFVVAGPLGDTASQAAGELTPGSSGVVSALLAVLRAVESVAGALPAFGVMALLVAAGLGALAWLGETTLLLAFAGGERSYRVLGRNRALFDFAEAVSGKLMQLSR